MLNASIMHHEAPCSMQVLCTMHNGKDYHAPCSIPPLGEILVSGTRPFKVHSIASVSTAGEDHMNKPSDEVRDRSEKNR